MAAIDVGPPKVDLLRIRAGDRNLFKMKLVQNGSPIDLTDLTIEAQVRSVPLAETIALSASITVTDAAEGEFEMRWLGEDVRTLLANKSGWTGVWDLEISSDGLDIQTLMAGIFTIEPDVTRADVIV